MRQLSEFTFRYVAELRSLVEFYVKPLLDASSGHASSPPATHASAASDSSIQTQRELPIAARYSATPKSSSVLPSFTHPPLSTRRTNDNGDLRRTDTFSDSFGRISVQSQATQTTHQVDGMTNRSYSQTTMQSRPVTRSSACTSEVTRPIAIPQPLREALEAIDSMLRGHEKLCAQLSVWILSCYP